MDEDFPLFADFEDLWVVYYLTGPGVRAVHSEWYSKGAALAAIEDLKSCHIECAIGRTIRFILCDA